MEGIPSSESSILSDESDTLSSDDLNLIGRFTVLLHSRTCPLSTVNQTRQSLFAQGKIEH